jgi:hypothetical protein
MRSFVRGTFVPEVLCTQEWEFQLLEELRETLERVPQDKWKHIRGRINLRIKEDLSNDNYEFPLWVHNVGNDRIGPLCHVMDVVLTADGYKIFEDWVRSRRANPSEFIFWESHTQYHKSKHGLELVWRGLYRGRYDRDLIWEDGEWWWSTEMVIAGDLGKMPFLRELCQFGAQGTLTIDDDCRDCEHKFPEITGMYDHIDNLKEILY